MAGFSRTQARGTKILKTIKKMNGSTFEGWIFKVEDADGNRHDWLDTTTRSNATKATIKSAIESHLQNNIEKRARPVNYTFTEVTDKGKGERVG
tara:strand:- start:841 stop:1122 length:282 start_codon:yes stop_codon:yes gene_type:complete